MACADNCPNCQAADKIMELQQELERTQANLKTVTQKLATSLPIAPPETIAEKAAIVMLQAMTPEQVTSWLGVVYEHRYEQNQRALEAMREG